MISSKEFVYGTLSNYISNLVTTLEEQTEIKRTSFVTNAKNILLMSFHFEISNILLIHSFYKNTKCLIQNPQSTV